jgi:superfamily II DNA/RNA helicase
MMKQIRELERGCDLIVATPGMLLCTSVLFCSLLIELLYRSFERSLRAWKGFALSYPIFVP